MNVTLGVQKQHAVDHLRTPTEGGLIVISPSFDLLRDGASRNVFHDEKIMPTDLPKVVSLDQILVLQLQRVGYLLPEPLPRDVCHWKSPSMQHLNCNACPI